jgi:hypothetical protein
VSVSTSGDLRATATQLARAGEGFEIAANLSVTVDGIDLAVCTVEDRIRVQIPSVRAAVRLARGERGRLPTIARLLAEADQTAELRVGSAVLAVVGADATPDRLAMLLSLGQVETRPGAVLPAALRLR